MATFKFLIQSKKAPAGIYVRIKDGTQLDIKAKTPFSVNPADWSQAKGAPKNREADLKILAAELEFLKAKLLHHYNVSVTRETIDITWLKTFLSQGKKQERGIPNLLEFARKLDEARKNELSKATKKKHRYIIGWIARYQKHIGRELEVKDINPQFKRSFEDYFLSLNYGHNTIIRAIKHVKSICSFARSEGMELSKDFEKVKANFKRTSIVYLSKEEIGQIKNLVLESGPLDTARDWLLISCETGQRISDFLQFNSDMLTRTQLEHRPVTLIHFIQKKTQKKVMLPLSKLVLDILDKYDGQFPPKISEIPYNECIKEVCRLAGLTKPTKGAKLCPVQRRKLEGTFQKWELVTSHIGRRSFASNHYGHIPTPLIMSATGHMTEKQFLEYVGKSEVSYAHQLAQYLL